MDLEPEAYQPTISFFPPPGAAKSVFDLKSNQCRFPIGDPASFEFRFCCKPTPTDREPRYCNECLKKATIPRRRALADWGVTTRDADALFKKTGERV